MGLRGKSHFCRVGFLWTGSLAKIDYKEQVSYGQDGCKSKVFGTHGADCVRSVYQLTPVPVVSAKFHRNGVHEIISTGKSRLASQTSPGKSRSSTVPLHLAVV